MKIIKHYKNGIQHHAVECIPRKEKVFRLQQASTLAETNTQRKIFSESSSNSMNETS